MATQCRHCQHFSRFAKYCAIGNCSKKKRDVHERDKSCEMFDFNKEIERKRNGGSK